MTSETQHIKLFTNQACLTASAIEGIIRGTLSDKQYEEANKHISSCELCREAVAGAGKFDDIEDFDQGISELQDRWVFKYGSKNYFRNSKTALISIAATILLLIGISIFYFANKEIYQDSFTDLPENGILIDSALYDEVCPVSTNQKYAELNRMEAKSRFLYLSDTNKQESPLLIAKIENTKIYASVFDLEESQSDAYSEKIIRSTTSHLRYPYVVMSRPPAYLELEMPSEEYERNETFIIVEDMPEFRGGDLYSFSNYIQQQIAYPQKAVEKHISGRVYVQFTINKTGEMIDAKIIKSVHPILDSEVLRVINNSPLWQPGRQRDRPVNVSMLMPVDFFLN